MPIYKYEGKKYNIPEDKVAEFERAFPNATVVMYAGDKTYNIPVSKQQAFKTSFDDASYNPIQAAADVEGVKTTENGSVVVNPEGGNEVNYTFGDMLKDTRDFISPKKKKRRTLADTLNASVPGVVNAEYTEAVNEGIEREVPLTQEEKDQRAAMRQRLQEDGTIDRMKESRKEARRDKLRAFGSMLGSTPQVTSFGVSTNVFDSTDEQLADVGQALDAGTEYRQSKLLQEKLDVALDMARAGENQDGLRGVENFGLGLWDSATRLSTWDFGASDIVNNLTLQQIVEKWENDPSSLTATEQKVLEGIGMATAVQELYSDQVGIGYNVGQSLPESAGFMASMALNPASGLGKSLARNAVRTYGRNSIAKSLARIGGDIAETAIMTATTGAGRVAADALERINGSSTYEIGENGVIMYGGQKDQETVGNAVIKAIGANFIENYSEALGEYFDPLLGMSRKVAAGGLRKMHLDKWADALSDVQPSQMTASIRALREKTKFGGIFGEVMEEEIGMALNTLFVGDNQWSDFVDLETQLTTVLSCAIMSGTLTGVEQVSSVAARRGMEKNAKNAEQEALYRFGSKKFDPLREAIDQASPEGMVDVLRDVYMSQEYTVGQKRALAEYAAARLQLQYYNAADAKARRQVNKTQQELLDAQEAGLNAQLPQFYSIARAAQSAEEDLLDYEGDYNLIDIIRSCVNKPEEMERILGDLPRSEAQLVSNYIYSRARMDGAYQGRSNRAEDYVDDFAYALEPAVVTDAEGNRTITTALLGDRSVYVLDNNGDLAHIMRPDGSKTLIKASELTNITTSSAEEVIDRYRDMYTSEYNAETENAFEHHPKTQAPQVGLQLQSPEGEVVITAVNDNMVEIVPAVYKDGQVQPKEGAEPKTITVDDAYAWQDDYYQGLDDAAAATASQPTVDNMSAETTENESTPTEQIEQSVSEEVVDGQNIEIQPTEEVAESVASAAPQTARERVPKDKKGNPIYEQTDADTAWDAIVEETEGNVEMAQSVAEQMLANKKAALDKLQKGKAKAGANVAQIIANEKKHQEAIAKAEADVKAWERIAQVNIIRQQKAELERAEAEKTEAEQRRSEEIYAEDTDYQQRIATFADENQGTDAGLREDATGVTEAEDDRAGSSVSAQPDVDFTREEIENGEVVSEQEYEDGKRKVTDNAEDVRRTPLSELEYVKRETDRLFNEREDQSLSREEWELTDEGVDAENAAIDSYPSYIQSLSDSGELQRMFDLASVGEEIQIRRAVEAAGFELDDVVDTSVKRANAKAARDKKRAEKAKKLIESVTTNKGKQNGAKETIPEGGPRGRRSEKQGENQGDTRQSKSVIGRQIEEFELRTGWSRELSDTERLILEDVRKLTDSEIAALRNEAIESIERGEDVEDIEIVLSLLEKYGRSGERLYILSQSGIIPNQPVLLDKVEQLFMEYNEDEGLAILFDRLRPIIEQINPKITFEVIRDVDGNVKDSTVGDFYLKDNHLRFNLHSLNSSYQTDQEKASTIVHEMIHAITQYAIDANERGDKTLPKNVLEAAKSLVNIYNQIKDNEIFNTTEVDEEGNIIRDYGVKDVHEMISELANPEFREKLKQIDVKGKNAWERIIDAIARFINQFKDIYDTTAYGKAVRALDALMDNFNLDAYEQSMVMSDGQALCNIRTYREFGRDRLQAYVGDKVAEGILSAEDGADIIQQMDDIYEAVQKYTDVYVPFGNWSEAEVVMRDGRPVFSVVKPNGDYKMNLDFSLVCKKRRTLDAVFDELIKRGAIENVSLEQVDIARINDIIRDHAFEVACSLCFVDAKRFRIAEVADEFCKMYNELVDKSDKQLQSIVNKTKKNTVRKKIAQLLLDEPINRIKLSRENFMSAKGFDDMKVNAEEIMKLYNAKKGTGGPKASSADVQYHNDVLDKNWTPEAAYSVGGVRLQSFSDYVPRLVFDYIQMIADLSAKQLPVHAYTKEELFARQFGLTGIKINMSLVPSYRADGVATGLDKDGNYVWEQRQTFDYDEAVEIQNAEGYRENCGTIAVGVSDEHISKMLDDENIRMVIPYHKSGINKKVAVHNHIDKFTDYTNEQSTRDAKGKKLSKEILKDEPNFNENLRKLGDPRAAAQAYLDWCDEKGYLPKFDKWRNHPNYYKLLEDFTTIIPSESGEQVVPQRGVTMTFPNAENAFGSLESLIARGLEEDAVLEGRRDKEVPVIADEVESELLRFRDDNNAELKEKYTDEQIFDAAKQKFGVTDDIREAGYILPDGSMLDFSGRYAVDGDASHLKGGRHMDHREVNQIAYDANDNETGLETNITDFIERGAIRIHYSNNGVGVINLNIVPTKEQKAKLRQLISVHNGNMDVDFGNGWSTEHHAEYDNAKAARVLGDIDRYYIEGVRPEGNILFRDGAPFFSNAERAVENIKQQKATPEQWLAMIKKDGGLKAGEDKWMGLSDWLNEQKNQGVKTLTKDEVLQFIRENQIEIEEVEYGDLGDTRLEELQAEFDELVTLAEEETGSIYTSDWADWAFEAMVESYGDDFRNAFRVEQGYNTFPRLEAEEDYDGNMNDAAKHFLGANPINFTRLDYTTEGLDYKREIALVVPTIEPWNETDEVHFGDAGEGRAVAWVRFGETTDKDGNRVLVIDEVQSKRHDEGRSKGYSDLRDYDKKMAALEEEAAELLARRNKLIKVLDEKYGGFTKYLKHSFVGQRTSLVPNPSVMTAEEIKEWNETSQDSIREREDELKKLKRGIPDAPFDKNYHELVMKRMLRYAAENGFDKVAWTKGAQQAERYNLGGVVDKITSQDYGVDDNGDAIRLIQIRLKGEKDDLHLEVNKDGIIQTGGQEYEGKHLGNVVGKDTAVKLMTNDITVSGNGLRVGDEGRGALYDEMIPRFMNKYTKKWGTTVGEVTLPEVEEAGRTMWSVDVTPEMRESVMQGQPMFREGMGAISDREVSYENDPIAKFQGKPRYYGKRAAAFAERERRRMENAAKEAAEMLGIEAEIVTDASMLQGRKAKAKGWYDIVNKKVVVVVPNHVSMGDAVRTVLHEGVAHHGLRELFGDGFDAMLDNVYNNVAPELKARIDAIAERTGVSTSVATEEYLASLAETTNFEEAQRRGWWQKIKSYFVDMLRKLAMPGLKLKEEITDNELRYLLWRSYKNLVEPDSYLKPLGYAEDVVKQKELKVGEYAEKAQKETPRAAEPSENNTTSKERNGAVAGNSSFEGLKQERSEHLSRQSLSSQVSDAKLAENTEMAKRKIKKLINEGLRIDNATPNDIVRSLGRAIGMKKSKSSNSFYSDYYEGDYSIEGHSVRVRLSQHPANAERFGASKTENRISIVVFKDGEHKGNVIAPYSEYTYHIGKLTPNEIASSIINGLNQLLKGDGFDVDESVVEHIDYETEGDDIRYRTSEEIEAEYPNWMEGTTTDSGKHSTQVEGTRKTYNKVGDWIEENLGKDVSILDASSGMGYGTADLRERGFNIEDVEPYQSEERKKNNPATYSSYADIDKKYDFIISNAVLNVIPDDWRRDVLHNMAERMNDGGKLFINTRKAGEEKAIKDKIELDTPQEVLVKRNGKIASYQKFFTPQELKAWVESELGDGYIVEVANKKNSGTSGLAAVVVTKKAERRREAEIIDEGWYNREELVQSVIDEAAALGVSVNIANSADELPDYAREEVESGRPSKGWYNTENGEIIVYAPHITSPNDAKRTVLHEIVGHKGLRQLIGEQRYDKAMLQLMYMLPADVRDAVLRRAERHGWNAAIAMDEYLAEQAERDVQPTWWGKVNAKIRAILRNIGFNVKLTDADVTYLLWRSRKKLQGDSLNDMAVNAILKQAARKSADAEAWNEQAFQDAEMRDFESNALPSIRHRMGADTNDYEKAVRTLGFKQAESWQDSMRSLKVFMDVISKESGKKIDDFENAYMYENRMSSANLMEMEQYRHMVYNPLLKEIHELEQTGASRESIINYLFAKSGLERNEVFARRDAKKHAEGDAAKEQQLYDKYRQKDYAGLTALTRGDAQIAALVDDHSKKKTEYERLEQNKKRGVAVSDADLKAAKKEMNDARKAMITAIEAEAQRMVDEFEAQHNTDNLWDKIRNCTHTTLNISHDAGVMSDDVYNELWNQFQYYIPLRGFAETTAEDVYLYLGGSDSPYNAPIKTAYGRTSLADDPIATIGNMAESAIVEANRNRLKQRFLYMVERHNTDLASISDVWLEYDDVNDEWHTLFAQIPDNATPSEAKRLQQEFEDRMKLLAEQNPGKYANASQQPNIPYRVVKKGDRQEHFIIVKRNGKDVVITINGNPRVAQAINGLTNPEQNQGMITRITSWINRNLSANFTMRNPAFMVSNFVRDGFYTNSMVWVKENPAYAWQYNQNWMQCTAKIMGLVSRYKRYEKGDTSALDMNNDMDRMFYEFMINGGETGYTVIKSVEDYKGLISGEMKKMEAGAMGTARRVADTIGNVVDTFGRWAEDTSRFAAYMTSRQLGRTIAKSIWDAKEISVNFNKKGSGNRMMGKFEQGNRMNYVLSNMSQLGRNLYVFWNAGMQGLNNFNKAAKKAPAKFTAMAGTYFALGVLVAAAFSGDDDEDDYYNLPEYVRRNNICFKIGKGRYATLPLPIEIRAIYGLGELAYSYLSGREGLTHGEAVTKTIQQMTQIMPIDMMADGGGAMALVPSAAKPVVEVIHNVDWTGRPIYKEKTPWNQNDPTWTLAFKSTSPELVQMSRLVNEWTNKNTADGLERPYNRGWADNRYLNNPAVWEHIAEGYLGGVATMFNQTKKTLMMPFNEDLREVRNVPIVSRFVKYAGKEGNTYAIRNEYYDAKDKMESWKNEISKLKKEMVDPSLTDEQRDAAIRLRGSLEDMYMDAIGPWDALDRQRKAMEEAYRNEPTEELRQELDAVMKEMSDIVEIFRN